MVAFQASGRNPARYSIGHSAPYSVADGSPECHCSTELIPSYPFSKLPIQTPSPVYSPVHGVQYAGVTGLISITSVGKINYEGCGAGHLTSCTTLFTFPRPHTHIPKGGHTCWNKEKEGQVTTLFTLEGHHLGDCFSMPGEEHWECLFVELIAAYPPTRKNPGLLRHLSWSLKGEMRP